MVEVVIVNWNSGPQLVECVQSVTANSEGCLARVIVVDNGSTDGSDKAVESLVGVEVIRTGENLGFAAACNIGARQTVSRYLLFLNPDARVEAGSLSAALAFMDLSESSKIGICGVQLRDDRGQVSRSCARLPTLGRFVAQALGLNKVPGLRAIGVRMCDWDHAHTGRVDHVIGAFFLIRKELFESLGGFDERFFVYLEDLDLSFRARQAGWMSMFLANVHAFHAGGGTSRQVKAHRLFYSLRSRLLYGFKHFPRWKAWVLVGVTGVVEPASRSVWCLARGDWAGLHHTWDAYRMLWGGMRRIVRGEGRFAP